jgi:uncharacterized protein (TIGR02265 family)
MLQAVSRRRQAAVEEVSQFCDLRERLALMPPSAAVRGIYFRSIELKLEQAGKFEDFRRMYPDRLAAIRWHSMSSFLEQLAVAGALLRKPTEVHAGMFEIGRQNATAFAGSLLGKMLLRMLSREPRKLLAQVSGNSAFPRSSRPRSR